MKTIIVPLDGSELAEQALPLASAIATKHHAEILLTTAISPGDRWIDDGIVRQWKAEEEAAVGSYLQSVMEKLKERRVRARMHVDWGRPHIVIGSVADREDADLIVMTTHGRSGISRWTLGSAADKVLRTLSTPLILIHPTTGAPPPDSVKRIVVPLDGSALAEAALPEAERLARTMDGSLLLVRAVVPAALVFGGEALPGALPVLEDMEAEAKQYLERVAARIRKRGVEVGVAVAVGVPAEVILGLGGDNGANLVVMTTHGRSGLDRAVFGSVADAVVRRGELPVMVIRSWVSLAEGGRREMPVAGNVVVPPPELTETEQVAASPRVRRGGQRPHRPERSPGR
jgi:nucleotide-binding universal stress UspA family protein